MKEIYRVTPFLIIDTKVEIDYDEDRPTTCLDIQQILPTVIILILTLVFMATVIPYVFYVVIQQLKDQFGEDENGKTNDSYVRCYTHKFIPSQIAMKSNNQTHSTSTISSFHLNGSNLFVSDGHNTVDILDAQPG